MKTIQSESTKKKIGLEWLFDNFFSKKGQIINVKKGQILLKQGDQNERLYYVMSGSVSGFLQPRDGEPLKLFTAHQDMIAGVYSFFSEDGHSYTTVMADDDSSICYLDKNQTPVEGDPKYGEFMKNVMPIVVHEIYLRQTKLMKSNIEKQQTMNKLFESEKLATLGQLSAGLAHELNNAIGVIQNQAIWLSEHLKAFFPDLEGNDAFRFYESGLLKGQRLSSSEIRKRRKKLTSGHHITDVQAKRLAKMNISDDELDFLLKRRSGQFMEQVTYFWETGQALHDINVASKHTSHVVHSIRELGAPTTNGMKVCYVHETIQKALTLLSPVLKKIELELNLNERLLITANEGKLVQAWLNLIKNAAESLIENEVENSKIAIDAAAHAKGIKVSIEDNGPGIGPELLPIVFQPNVTTKIQGLSFGLGLGLSIVQRIIIDLGGTIDVKSVPGATQFIVQIPK